MKKIHEIPQKFGRNSSRFCVSCSMFYVLFFLSGFSALIYQIIWMRKLALIFGHSAYATSATISIFFAGLAIGSYVAGRIIKNRFSLIDKPISADQLNAKRYLPAVALAKEGTLDLPVQAGARRLYSLVELLIGTTALSTLFLIPLISTFPLPAVITPATIIYTLLYSSAVLILPSVLIGMTFPVMVQFVPNIAAVYAVNTLGATLGTFLTGFFLIAALGINQTLLMACGINLLIGLTVWRFGSRISLRLDEVGANRYSSIGEKQTAQSVSIPNTKDQRLKTNYLIPIALFLSGFLSLALEILLTRALILSFGSSTYAFSTILTAFLAGIAIGSFLAAGLFNRSRRKYIWFAVLTVLTALVTLGLIAVIGNLPLIFLSLTKDKLSFISVQSVIFALSFFSVSSITILMGLTFPLGISLYRDITSRSDSIAKLYSLNTVGGIIGSLIAGFVMITALGVEKSFLTVAIVYFILGLILVWPVMTGNKRLIIAAFLTISFIFFINKIPKWSQKVNTLGSFIYKNQLAGQNPDQIRSQIIGRKLLYYKDGLSGNVAVTQDNGEISLRINGKADASTGNDLPAELLIGHLPMIYSGQYENVLVIGLGSGISLGAITNYPAKSIDVVEIEPAVAEAAGLFKEYNNYALSDSRVNLAINDARNFLTKTDKKYDVISSEPSNPWISGIANLFTYEFFNIANNHLTDDGVMLQWIHLYYLSPEDLKSVIATFKSVFTDVHAWTTLYTDDLLLIGLKKDTFLNPESVAQIMKNKKVSDDLSRIGIFKPEDLFRHYLAGKSEISSLSEGARLHADNLPFLEFSAPKALWSNYVFDNLRLLFTNRAKELHSQSTFDKLSVNPALALRNEVLTLRESEVTNGLSSQLLIRDSLLSASILEENDPDKALKLTEDVYKLVPDVVQIKLSLSSLYYQKAQNYFIEGKIPEAKEYLEKSVEYNPEHSTARLNLAGLYLINSEELPKAKLHLDEGAKLSPDRPELYINYANYYLVQNQPDDARKAVEKALSLDPENSIAIELKSKLVK